MYTIIKESHSIIALIVLITLLLACVVAIYGWINHKEFTKSNKLTALLGLIAAHLQMGVGFVTYLVSPLGLANFSGESMKNPVSRLYIVEHPVMMMIAVILITIGYSKAKRQTDSLKKNRTIALCYSVGLFLILLRIPWSAWL